jgi:hypothetical protein
MLCYLALHFDRKSEHTSSSSTRDTFYLVSRKMQKRTLSQHPIFDANYSLHRTIGPQSAAFAPAHILREEGPAPPPLSALPPVTANSGEDNGAPNASGSGNTSGNTSSNTSGSASGSSASKLITDPTLIAAAALKATAPNAAANAVHAVKYAANAEREVGARSTKSSSSASSTLNASSSSGIIGASSPHRPGALSSASLSAGGSGSGSGSADASGSSGSSTNTSGGLAAAISMAAARRATRGRGGSSGSSGSGDEAAESKLSASAQKMLTPPLSTQIEVYVRNSFAALIGLGSTSHILFSQITFSS